MRATRSAFLAFLLVPSVALADVFSDFRIPDHRLFVWNAATFWSGSRSSGHGAPLEQSKSSFGSGDLRTDGLHLRDSDDRRTQLSAVLDGLARRSRDESESFGTRQRYRLRTLEERAYLAASERRYPWATPIGIGLSIGASAFTSQAWRRIAFDQSFPPTSFQQRASLEGWRYQYQVAGSFEAGYGRVRDATAVFDALTLEQRLRRSGALRGPLPEGSIQRIAQWLYIRGPLGSVFGRPAKKVWAELLALLREEGALEGEVEPEAAARAMEPYIGSGAGALPAFSPILRQRGTYGGLAVQATHAHAIVRFSQEQVSRQFVNDTLQSEDMQTFPFRGDLSSDRVLLGPVLESHWPLGVRWQADLSDQLFFSSKDTREFQLLSEGSLAFIVADRWLAHGDVAYWRSTQEPEEIAPLANPWTATYGLGLSWYLEDHLELSLNASGYQARLRLFSSESYDRQEGLTLGLSYRIAGRLKAPGFIEPLSIH